MRQPENQPAAAGHRLAGIHEQVQEHLLELARIARHLRHRGEFPLHLHAVFHQLPLEQHEHVFDQQVEVHRLEAGRAGSRHAQHAGGDLRGPGAGRQDAFERLVASRLITMPKPHLGVIEDRRQGIVEFVRRGAQEFAQAGELAGLEHLTAELGHLGRVPQAGNLQLPLQHRGLVDAAGGDRGERAARRRRRLACSRLFERPGGLVCQVHDPSLPLPRPRRPPPCNSGSSCPNRIPCLEGRNEETGAFYPPSLIPTPLRSGGCVSSCRIDCLDVPTVQLRRRTFWTTRPFKCRLVRQSSAPSLRHPLAPLWSSL